eukprot:CAMPEP_0176377732 /NCGR_PEP_ID=MMETSP0126-20121128/29105_1 /TAXON_ID=141414 ORGANISM="Strombidinopsis acuminatum, Strain SPMC142" /NCGR_SAMPLE_ID=MMETSP0126 /ASSEMBLY_ACC=CAM_ASM_000229 /LENGTH=62 /DNA_ID=CAMNT_0017739709 /DNA_START=20 /DNA_END=204 /DNA_ORIENTATION=-
MFDSYMPHPNSLLFNVFIIPFYPFKFYWFLRKTTQLVTLNDFPTPPENSEDAKLGRRYFNFS